MKQNMRYREMVCINGVEYPAIHESVFFRDWEDVPGIPASEITHRDTDTEQLDGLLIRGYEMKFGRGKNENWEVYEKSAFDEFVEDYFVKKNLNMVCDINHEGYYDWHAQCGRVIYMEVNSVGLYFVVYIPRTFESYNELKTRIEEGIIQGFSKEGYAVDYEWKYTESGEFDYELVKKINLISVSLVSTPANGLRFEKRQEIKNGLHYVNKLINEEPHAVNTMEALFNINHQ